MYRCSWLDRSQMQHHRRGSADKELIPPECGIARHRSVGSPVVLLSDRECPNQKLHRHHQNGGILATIPPEGHRSIHSSLDDDPTIFMFLYAWRCYNW